MDRRRTEQAFKGPVEGHGISSSVREAEQRLTSSVKVSVSEACGLTALSLQGSISDAVAAQLAASSSLPANRAFFAQCYRPHLALNPARRGDR